MKITKERIDKLEECILEILEEKSKGKDSTHMKATEIDLALKFIRSFRKRLQEKYQESFQQELTPSFNLEELELPFD